ncbi:hypothetical protein GWN75_16175 [candidate division KSB1 bacterium]|nr:hypothetical protein [candidate division KSB1 bacterium]NIR68337.1 hypothetical protein [candidate division KSB1 bacterium]NIS25303.1 hypothetical protein [candidate division KSB1 bacterium]NIU26024.1 hypothetical protein [candidate division KSB1 bacterium]NIU90843.1 hypothetical protein [candidate division KSB1 bacterium]
MVFYLISIILAPLFHHHAEEHHHDSVNSGYHSHTAPFSTHTSAHHADGKQEDTTSQHFCDTITAHEDMVGVIQGHSGNTFNPVKFLSTLVSSIKSSLESNSHKVSRQYAFNLLPLQPQQDYCVLTATNLSPPQA